MHAIVAEIRGIRSEAETHVDECKAALDKLVEMEKKCATVLSSHVHTLANGPARLIALALDSDTIRSAWFASSASRHVVWSRLLSAKCVQVRHPGDEPANLDTILDVVHMVKQGAFRASELELECTGLGTQILLRAFGRNLLRLSIPSDPEYLLPLQLYMRNLVPGMPPGSHPREPLSPYYIDLDKHAASLGTSLPRSDGSLEKLQSLRLNMLDWHVSSRDSLTKTWERLVHRTSDKLTELELFADLYRANWWRAMDCVRDVLDSIPKLQVLRLVNAQNMHNIPGSNTFCNRETILVLLIQAPSLIVESPSPVYFFSNLRILQLPRVVFDSVNEFDMVLSRTQNGCRHLVYFDMCIDDITQPYRRPNQETLQRYSGTFVNALRKLRFARFYAFDSPLSTTSLSAASIRPGAIEAAKRVWEREDDKEWIQRRNAKLKKHNIPTDFLGANVEVDVRDPENRVADSRVSTAAGILLDLVLDEFAPEAVYSRTDHRPSTLTLTC